MFGVCGRTLNVHLITSCAVAGGAGEKLSPALNFGLNLSENILVVGKFGSKCKNRS